MSGKETPATLAAARAKVPWRLLEYDHDPEAGAVGLHAAEALGLDPALVYKTLVAVVDGTKLVVGVIPVAARLNLKALAALAGGKKADMADPAKAEKTTGYVVGGISPLGQRKRLPTFLDAAALSLPRIYVSAGRRGLQIELDPADLVRLTGATTG